MTPFLMAYLLINVTGGLSGSSEQWHRVEIIRVRQAVSHDNQSASTS